MSTKEIDQTGPIVLSTEDIEKLRKCLKILWNPAKTPTPSVVDTILNKPLSGTSCVLSPQDFINLHLYILEENKWAIQELKLVAKEHKQLGKWLETNAAIPEAYDTVLDIIYSANKALHEFF